MLEMTLDEWNAREIDSTKEGWIVVEVEGMKNSSVGFPYVVLDPQTGNLLEDYITNWRPTSKSNRVFLNKRGNNISDSTLHYWMNLKYQLFRKETQVHFQRPLMETYQCSTQRRAINTKTRHEKSEHQPPQGMLNQALVQMEETGENQYTLMAAAAEAMGVAKWTHSAMKNEIDPKENVFYYTPIETQPIQM